MRRMNERAFFLFLVKRDSRIFQACKKTGMDDIDKQKNTNTCTRACEAMSKSSWLWLQVLTHTMIANLFYGSINILRAFDSADDRDTTTSTRELAGTLYSTSHQ